MGWSYCLLLLDHTLLTKVYAVRTLESGNLAEICKSNFKLLKLSGYDSFSSFQIFNLLFDPSWKDHSPCFFGFVCWVVVDGV